MARASFCTRTTVDLPVAPGESWPVAAWSYCLTERMVASVFMGTVTALNSPQTHFTHLTKSVPLICSPSCNGFQPIDNPRTSGGSAVKADHASSTSVFSRLGFDTFETRALM